MPWGWAAGALALGGVASAAIGSSAASSAADAQVAAADKGAAVQQNIFDTTQKNLSPFIQGGQNSLPLLMQLMGITPGTQGTPGTPANPGGFDPTTGVYTSPTDAVAGTPGTAPTFNPNGTLVAPQGQFTPGQSTFSYGDFAGAPAPLSLGTLGAPAPFSFNPSDLASTPGYQFQLNQGLGAIQNQAAKGGGALGGDSLKAMQDYAQGLAGTTYNSAFGQQLGAYQTNAAVPLNYLTANNAATQGAYSTNFDTNLATYGTNQGNSLQSFLNNYQTGLSTFDTNANVTQQNKTNIYSMLNSLLQTGQTSAAGAGNIGATTGASIGNSYASAGNAAAAGTVGSANAITGAINGGMGNLAQLYALSKLGA